MKRGQETQTWPLPSILPCGLPDYWWSFCKLPVVISGFSQSSYTLLSSPNIRASLGWTYFNEWIWGTLLCLGPVHGSLRWPVCLLTSEFAAFISPNLNEVEMERNHSIQIQGLLLYWRVLISFKTLTETHERNTPSGHQKRCAVLFRSVESKANYTDTLLWHTEVFTYTTYLKA